MTPRRFAALICAASNLFSFSRMSLPKSVSSGNNSCVRASVKKVNNQYIDEHMLGVFTNPEHFGLDVTELRDKMMVIAHHRCYFLTAPVECKR
jgi:hypothetical protein